MIIRCIWAILSLNLLCQAKIRIRNAKLVSLKDSNVRLDFGDIQRRCKNIEDNLVFVLDRSGHPGSSEFQLVTSFTLIKHLQLIPFEGQLNYDKNNRVVIFEEGTENGLPKGFEIQVWPGKGYDLLYHSRIRGEYMHKVTFVRGPLADKIAIVFDCAYELVVEDSEDEEPLSGVSEEAIKVLGMEYFISDPFLQAATKDDTMKTVKNDNFISAGFYGKGQGHLVDPELVLYKGLYYRVSLEKTNYSSQLFPPILAKSSLDKKLRFPPLIKDGNAFRVLAEADDDQFLILQDPEMRYQLKKNIWWSLTTATCLRSNVDLTVWTIIVFLLGSLADLGFIYGCVLFNMVFFQNARSIPFVHALIVSVLALSFATLAKVLPGFNIRRLAFIAIIVFTVVLPCLRLWGILPNVVTALLVLTRCFKISGTTALLAVMAFAVKLAPKIPAIEACIKWGIPVGFVFEPDVMVLLGLSILGESKRSGSGRRISQLALFLATFGLPFLRLYHLWPTFIIYLMLMQVYSLIYAK